ncbi:23S rRNA (guanosine(2251)-2'-O)-methyltransferase RlmB [Sneathiella sp. P13V-1]|uniref:23S rRNA (guanosine(2251)-2'-O)-methyltransferase RlmB n=1 Tax=Sneathiella sp. P13V-1 TaxID=2697366 RepID=UPI00187BA949|nr:23S rRNA (guanosine(2251)-2'-O)-methyltransferase RlmB [Sneathiella sp. P13V-1]MBE7636735.1 23S rRNA (guanosine(2251)-2'-O)-methyltransferase RlmB [Sneathiella sp. P13V-1]
MRTRKTPKGQKPNFFQGSPKQGAQHQKTAKSRKSHPDRDSWLYGDHAVLSALANPKRKIQRFICTENKLKRLLEEHPDLILNPSQVEVKTGEEIADLLPDNAIHQNIALKASGLPDYDILDIEKIQINAEYSTVAILDQVTDPHNVGAILRSAAAFEIDALILPARHSPEITGVLARSASGAVETVPILRVNNLSRAMDQLAELGYWRIGLDGHADKDLEGAIQSAQKIALVLGSEGKGLRRLTAEKCDLMGKLPISPKIESLNVSNAAAISFYEVAKLRSKSIS